MRKGFIIGGLIALFLTFVIGGMWISAYNGEIAKRNKVVALQKDCQNIFDNAYKIVAQDVQMARENVDKSKDDFKEIYGLMMDKRYKEGEAQFMKWTQENNPEFDLKATTSLYSKLMDAIEANRRDFMQSQTDLIAAKESYDNFIESFPRNIFLSKEKIKITIITSSKTDKIFSTGKEDDIVL
jgi:hypothetical protein